MNALEPALLGLQQALDSPRRDHMWLWLVRHRMAGVREALTSEASRSADAWLTARVLTLLRERDGLLSRLSDLGPQVTEAADVELVRDEIQRLLADLDRHHQRLNDLVYDTVSLELGGSE